MLISVTCLSFSHMYTESANCRLFCPNFPRKNQRPNCWTQLGQKSEEFSPCYSQSPLLRILPPSPPLSKSGLKVVCNVNIVYGFLKSENSQDYAQKHQRIFTFVNSASVQFLKSCFERKSGIYKNLFSRRYKEDMAQLQTLVEVATGKANSMNFTGRHFLTNPVQSPNFKLLRSA